MGLDMNLYRERYFGYGSGEKAKQIKEIVGEKIDKDFCESVFVKSSVAYWRKANQIHRYFVDVIGDGIDNCEPIYVSKEELEKLLKICKEIMAKVKLVPGQVVESYTYNDKGEKVCNYVEGKVIDKPEICEKLLPTRAGFFFGDTDYDEWYLQDIEDTIKQLEDVFATDEGDCDYSYRASW